VHVRTGEEQAAVQRTDYVGFGEDRMAEVDLVDACAKSMMVSTPALGLLALGSPVGYRAGAGGEARRPSVKAKS
jgi:hypothetical protein